MDSAPVGLGNPRLICRKRLTTTEPFVSTGGFYQSAASETEADVGSVRLLTEGGALIVLVMSFFHKPQLL